MKHLVICVVFVLFIVDSAFARYYRSSKDTSLIYGAIIKTLRKDQNFVVSNKITARNLKHFDFRHPLNYLILKNSVIVKDSLWRMFLNAVDTADIRDSYTVSRIEGADRKVKILTTGDVFPKRVASYIPNKPTLITFSPALISPAGKKAVVVMQDYYDADEQTTCIYFLEYKNVYPYVDRDPEWVVVYISLLNIT